MNSAVSRSGYVFFNSNPIATRPVWTSSLVPHLRRLLPCVRCALWSHSYCLASLLLLKSNNTKRIKAIGYHIRTDSSVFAVLWTALKSRPSRLSAERFVYLPFLSSSAPSAAAAAAATRRAHNATNPPSDGRDAPTCPSLLPPRPLETCPACVRARVWRNQNSRKQADYYLCTNPNQHLDEWLKWGLY